MCQSLFFNKVARLRPATLLKKRPWHKCLPVNFVKFLRTPFLQNTSGGCFSILHVSRRPDYASVPFDLFKNRNSQSLLDKVPLLASIHIVKPTKNPSRTTKKTYKKRTPFLQNTSGRLLLHEYRMCIM